MNAYILNTQTMQWPLYEGDIRLLYPNTSFPSPMTTLPTPYAWVAETPTPTYDQMTQGVKQVAPKQVNGEWCQSWEVYALSPEQIAVNQERAKEQNKQQAESLLQQTDWTATVDINNPQYSNPYLGNQDAFLAYRSQVRQIAVNPPVTVAAWPVMPKEVWVTV